MAPSDLPPGHLPPELPVYSPHHRRTAPVSVSPFNQRLYEARVAAGLSHRAAADLLSDLSGRSRSRQIVQRLESGRITEDTAEVLDVVALAEIYDVPVSYLSPSIDAKLGNVTALLHRASKRKPKTGPRTPRTTLKGGPRQVGGSTSRWSSASGAASRSARSPLGPPNRHDPSAPRAPFRRAG